jgi:hypothetical protein
MMVSGLACRLEQLQITGCAFFDDIALLPMQPLADRVGEAFFAGGR